MYIAGAIFDLDGVLTDTAALHERAWHRVTGCTHAEYLSCFDGRKRIDGLRRFLESRSSCGNEKYMSDLCIDKDAIYQELLRTEGVRVHDDAREILEVLGIDGAYPCPVAVASSSRNARAVVKAAGLVDEFAVIVDGNGPEKPASYVLAAEQMGVAFSECAVFEDSPDALMLAIQAGCKYGIYVRKDR